MYQRDVGGEVQQRELAKKTKGSEPSLGALSQSQPYVSEGGLEPPFPVKGTSTSS